MKTIGEMVSSDYRKAEVFKRFGIDFCCGGKKTIEKACLDKGVDINALKLALREVESSTIQSVDDEITRDPVFLTDYIIRVHHGYVRKSLPLLLEFTRKVADVHGVRAPEAVKIAELFQEVANEMSDHMVKEEQVLFPYIKKLASAGEKNIGASYFGTVKNPVAMMEHEHEIVGGLMEEIRELAGDYYPPEGACATWRVTYQKLEEFENDLHRHVHLENNVLFPQAVRLEDSMRK